MLVAAIVFFDRSYAYFIKGRLLTFLCWLAMGIPVVSGVNRMNVEAFKDFSGGMAEAAEADLDALEAWVMQAVKTPAE